MWCADIYIYICVCIHDLHFTRDEQDQNKIKLTYRIMYMLTVIILILPFVNYCEFLSMFIYIFYSIWSCRMISSRIELWSESVIHTRNVCKAYYDCFLLKVLLGMYVVYLTIDTPIHIWTMVRVDKTKLYWLLFFYQYQLVFDFILLRYSDLTASSPYLLTWQLVAISSCNAKMSNT